VIQQVCRHVLVLLKFLEGIADKEFAVGFFYPPVELAQKLARPSIAKKVHLTRKGVKEFVLTRANIPAASEETGIKLGDDLVGRCHWIGPIVGFLFHTRHVGDGTLVEFADDRVFKGIAALDLAFNFVRSIVAGVDAGYVGQAFGIEDALAEGNGAFLDKASDNLAGVGGGKCRWSDQRRWSKESCKGE
jgi:hypothetical protein